MQLATISEQLREFARQIDISAKEMYTPTPIGEIKRLCDFYAVTTVDELVLAQAAHVERLQATLSSPKDLALRKLRELTADIRTQRHG